MKEYLKKYGNETTCPVIAIVRDGKVLFGLRHYTPDKWKTISVWTCPGGRCDEGERVENTLRREVKEETGITEIEITDYLGEVPGAKEGDVVPLFIAITKEEPRLMEPEKFSDWRWFGVSDFPENFINSAAKELILRFLAK